MNSLLTANQLTQWSSERQAQEILPSLIRRLILCSTNPLLIVFPAGSSINRAGYDGFLQTAEQHHFIPSGQSVWEVSTDQNPKSKADEDYKKRKENPSPVAPSETVYIAVTSRRWNDKKAWEETKRAENLWADVKVLDADDLELWLDICPSVATWARRRIVGAPDGLRDIEEIWDAWSTRSNPTLSPNIFVAGRGLEVEKLQAWLSNPPSSLRIRADVADEAIGFRPVNAVTSCRG